jgi:ATP-dependent DNA helicase RecG
MEVWLDTDVSAVEGVSARAATVLRTVFEIRTVRDLLEHYPHRYRDVGAQIPVGEAELGDAITVVGVIARWTLPPPKTRMPTKALIATRDGAKVEAAFFKQPWLVKKHPQGSTVAVSGTLEKYRSTLQLRNPRLVELDDAASMYGPLDHVQPVYPATEALASPRIARFVAAALDALPPLDDYLPDVVLARRGLLDFDAAVRAIHRPPDLAAVRPARDRLVYDELLCLQIGLQQRRHRLEADAVGLAQPPVAGGLAERLFATLPFDPTPDQLDAVAEIEADLARPKPMHRLLQGEVGSGKTLVAARVMLDAVDHGRQAVLMAPTAVLAEQHYRTFSSLLAPLGVNVLDGPRLELLTGGTAAKKLRGLLAELAVGDIQLLIGTHALLEERVLFDDLGVVVIDEQHRFGVEHRTRLRAKTAGDVLPDVLVMTATPIPRSLALTLYGDLDVTVIRNPPAGRPPVVTQVLASDSPRRAKLEAFIRERVLTGERAYVVCPLVEDSDALEDVASAEQVHRRLATEVFPDLGVALVHGRLPAAERDARMEAFRDGTTPILVATTVIEVGVDVPEATVMVIEDANRFGISQLHQLRGRVGRGTAPSYCVLFSDEPEGNPRLEALASTRDGFKLAETDLELRGEGSLFDTRQSGLPDLKLATLSRDFEWVAASREDARAFVEVDPDLDAHPTLRDEVARRYGEERLEALETG